MPDSTTVENALLNTATDTGRSAGKRALNCLFAVHDWGLGHATRDLLLIRALLDAGHRVTVLSCGRALALLRQELGERCEFLEFRDIPKPLGKSAASFYIRMSLSMPRVLLTFRRERALTARLCRERGFDRVISDSRFGVVSRTVPSYYIFHSLRQIFPWRLAFMERRIEHNQQRMLADARRILIPDQPEHGIAGDLCHNMVFDWSNRIVYLGILSSIRAEPVTEDVDCFISISGAEPQRSYLEEKVLAQAGQLEGRIEIALGRPDLPYQCWHHGHVRVHTYLDRAGQQRMFNRAHIVVTRSGYTTLMELAELGKKAVLIPTVGQSEQEYLADYHQRQGHAHAVRQAQLDLPRDVRLAEHCTGLPRAHPTAESIERFLSLITAHDTEEFPAQPDDERQAQ